MEAQLRSQLEAMGLKNMFFYVIDDDADYEERSDEESCLSDILVS